MKAPETIAFYLTDRDIRVFVASPACAPRELLTPGRKCPSATMRSVRLLHAGDSRNVAERLAARGHSTDEVARGTPVAQRIRLHRDRVAGLPEGG